MQNFYDDLRDAPDRYLLLLNREYTALLKRPHLNDIQKVDIQHRLLLVKQEIVRRSIERSQQ